MTPPGGVIWIITGGREVGKTRFCSNLIRQAQAQGLQIEGVICPPEYQAGQKSAIQIVNLRTGESQILARARTSETEGMLTDRWVFDASVMAWGNHFLGEVQECDLLMIDELGPLEFTRHEGWQNGLQALDKRKFQSAVVVIRPELINAACQRWPDARVIEIPPGMERKTEETFQQMILSGIHSGSTR